MASLGSMGPHSLLRDSSSYSLSDTSPVIKCNIVSSEMDDSYVLKSPTLLSSLNRNFVVPDVHIQSHTDEPDRAPISEERFRSYASIYISPEKSAEPSNYQESKSLGEDEHLPSYLGISCAISGYTGYSRFCHSRENSPARVNGSPKMSMMSSKSSQGFEDSANTVTQPSRRISESYICNKYFSSSKDSIGINIAQKNFVSNQEITLRASYLSPSEYANGHIESLVSNGIHKDSALQANELPDNCDRKSLVQQRIESLFGQSASNSTCKVIRPSRSKLRIPVDDSTTQRSPSCPPESFRAASRSPPVFRHITKDFKEQLRNSPVPTKTNFTKVHSAALTITPNAKFELQKSLRNGFSPEPLAADVPLNAPESSHLFRSSPQSSVHTTTTKNVEQEMLRGGNAFIRKMDAETDKILIKIGEAEGDLKLPSLPEEASGKLRSAIGKANLLLQQKFKQFRELCQKNINPDPLEPFPTTEEDLAGFWDMVLIQVQDVNRVLDDMRLLKENGWKEGSMPQVKSSNRCKSRLVQVGPAISKRSTENSESSKIREERRKKLLAAKKKGRLQKTGDSEIAIFLPDDSK